MKIMRLFLPVAILIMVFVIENCKPMPEVDTLIVNAVIYTVNGSFDKVNCMAVKEGKIVETGEREEMEANYKVKETLDMAGRFIYPGFIDAHCHYYGYGLFNNYAQLKGTKSFDEIIDIVARYASATDTGWIIGRGWDQNDWENKKFPDNRILNRLFPDRPVILYRIDGHAVLVNRVAFEKTGLDTATYRPYMLFDKKGFTGLLIDKAADRAKAAIPGPNREQIKDAIKSAEEDCLAVGLTTVSDAGLDYDVVETLIEMDKKNELKIRIYVMLAPTIQNMEFVKKNGIYHSAHLYIGAIKLYADGALGSRGAVLLKPYADDPENIGFLLENAEYFDQYCRIAINNNYQLCSHCIGDSANRFVLDIYSQYLSPGNDRRWRIEHAQVVNPADIDKFGKYNIIPSVQPSHATSDMYWAEKRLGPERVKTAYAYKSLLNQNGWLPSGSDFPVENINPLFGFYAAVTRQDQNHFPGQGFQSGNALTKIEALKAMTLWAAKADFLENETGSLEKGKSADFVVLDRDIVEGDISGSYKAVVLKTFINGKMYFNKLR